MRRDLAAMVRKLRTERGWTQEQLAERVGVTRSYIALIETGQRKNLSRPAAKALAEALGIKPEELLGRKGGRTR